MGEHARKTQRRVIEVGGNHGGGGGLRSRGDGKCRASRRQTIAASLLALISTETAFGAVLRSEEQQHFAYPLFDSDYQLIPRTTP